MRYLVAHLIEGEAGAFHEHLTKELAERFGIVPLHEKIPPHVTLKAPFGGEVVADVERAIEAIARKSSASGVRYRGFGHFDTSVVFLKPELSPEALSAVDLLREGLRNVPGLSWGPYEKKLHVHASVARFLSPVEFKNVWRHVKNLKVEMPSTFGNLAILAERGERWDVYRRFPLS